MEKENKPKDIILNIACYICVSLWVIFLSLTMIILLCICGAMFLVLPAEITFLVLQLCNVSYFYPIWLHIILMIVGILLYVYIVFLIKTRNTYNIRDLYIK